MHFNRLRVSLVSRLVITTGRRKKRNLPSSPSSFLFFFFFLAPNVIVKVVVLLASVSFCFFCWSPRLSQGYQTADQKILRAPGVLVVFCREREREKWRVSRVFCFEAFQEGGVSPESLLQTVFNISLYLLFSSVGKTAEVSLSPLRRSGGSLFPSSNTPAVIRLSWDRVDVTTSSLEISSDTLGRRRRQKKKREGRRRRGSEGKETFLVRRRTFVIQQEEKKKRRLRWLETKKIELVKSSCFILFHSSDKKLACHVVSV